MANGALIGERIFRSHLAVIATGAWPVRAFLPLLTVATILGVAPRVEALQPLDVFLARAAEANPDVRISQATQAQRDAEADRATGSLLPSFQAQGTYTRNQYEVAFPTSFLEPGTTGSITIVPKNQLDGSFTLSVPLVDVGAWDRRAAAKAIRDGANANLASTRLDVMRRAARAYFQLLANEAVLLSARRNLELSQQNAALTVDKREGGTASELDVQRAKGDVATAEKQLATASLNVVRERRSLESLSGVTPAPATAFPADDLREESPLDAWLLSTEHVPAVTSAVAARESVRATASAAKTAWLPTLTASAQERLTNAPSLTLHNEYYLLQLMASWKLDATISANVRAQRAAIAGADARADRARRDIQDSIFDDWNQVHTSLELARASRAGVVAARAAADLARDRYQGGVATQLDVLQAKQDLFRADVDRIQAEANLSFARSSLRLDAARPIGDLR